jgi:hypothetical protein
MGYIGRHRRQFVPLRSVAMAVLYVGSLATWSAYASVVMSR